MSDQVRRLADHPKVLKAVRRPMVMGFGDDVTVVPKPEQLICDLCNGTVQIDGDDPEREGYALMCEDGCHVTHVACGECAEEVRE